MPEKQTFTLITCHFGDIFWVEKLMRNILQFEHEQISRIVVIDQSRNSQLLLSAIEGVDEVITFPVDDDQVANLGHDHPAALNHAIRMRDIDTTHVLIFDSDCIPIRSNWLSRIGLGPDVILAQDPNKWGLSHPCFMKLPVSILQKINFAEGTLEIGIDTGRLVGLQTVNLGYEPELLVPRPAFNGVQGDLYLDDSLLHVGSSSFMFSPDPRLAERVDRYRSKYIYRKILNSSYNLSKFQTLLFYIAAVVTRIVKWP